MKVGKDSVSVSSDGGREKPLILITDDQATVIRILSNMLQPEYDVCVATDGIRAIEVAKSQLPDLILLDNMMPGMTGVEACLALKADPITQHIPVIFITSMDDKHNERVGLNAGAVDYLNKPPSAEIVLARIKVHLQNDRQRKFIEKLAAGFITDLEAIRKEARNVL